MRWLVVPVVAASFVGALMVSRVPADSAAATRSSIEGAAIAETTLDTGTRDGRPSLLTRAVSGGAEVSANPTCAGPFKGSPAQVVVVGAEGTRATLIGCTRHSSGYRRTIGPFTARVGREGVAPPGRKREGDGRTPSGTFRLASGFGTAADPGLAQGWLRTNARDVWVDDPGSRFYNTQQRLPANGRWTSAERLKIPAYRYAQVIAYNTDRIRGRGSAIFLHVGTTPTAGCVALTTSDLVRVLRWERTGAVMVIS